MKDALGEAADDPEDALDAGVDLLLPTPIFDWFTSKRSWFSDYCTQNYYWWNKLAANCTSIQKNWSHIVLTSVQVNIRSRYDTVTVTGTDVSLFRCVRGLFYNT